MFRKLSLQHILIHVFIMGLIWWILVGEDQDSWMVGIPAIGLSLMVTALMPPLVKWRMNLLYLIPFILYFLSQSVFSGLDVIKRVFNPACPIDPQFISYTPQLKNEIALVFFANAISLLPGTFSADFKEDQLVIHLLDQQMPNIESIHVLEKKVAQLFCEDHGHG